jgi:serine/threonine-protein kinase/endoribonuclease IRE1
LDEILPNFTPGHPSLNLDKPKSIFVGMVKETGSLFAMTQDHFPLVAFSGGDSYARSRLIDSSNADFPPGVDDITKMRQSQKEIMEALERCEGDGVHYDRRCLIGIHEVKDADGPENRWKRLLDAPKNTRLPVQPHPAVDYNRSELERVPTSDFPTNSSPPRPDEHGPWSARSASVNGMQAAVLTLIIGLLSLWLGLKRMRESRRKGLVPVVPERQETTAAVGPAEKTPTSESDPVPAPSVSTDKPPPQAPEPIAIPNGAPLVPELEQKLLPQANGNGHDYAGAAEDSDRDGDVDGGDVNATVTPGKRKTRRGKRGKKKKTGVAEPVGDAEEEETAKGTAREDSAEPNPNGSASPSPTLIINSPKPAAATTSLIVSETILGMFSYLSNYIVTSIVNTLFFLGFGSHGTVVFQGSLQGRAVAVKRLLQDFVTLAAREVSILQESDDHPNVIRYYYQEAHANFLYIALELCPASLADIIESPDRDQWRDIAIVFDPKKALRQITSGLKHLHALKLVHRDIKPQNILVSGAKPGPGGKNTYRMLISDFGLCKKLDVDQTSFLPTAHGLWRQELSDGVRLKFYVAR